jgi:hypothetical protein
MRKRRLTTVELPMMLGAKVPEMRIPALVAEPSGTMPVKSGTMSVKINPYSRW